MGVGDFTARRTAIGGAGSMIHGGMISDHTESNGDLDAEKWYGSPSSAGVADKMLRDSHCRMSMEYVTGPLRAASWEFEAGGPSDLDKEAADFANWNFFKRLSWDRFLRDALLYKSHGFSLFEVTDDVERVPAKFTRHPGAGQGVVITGLHHRPAWSTHKWIQSKTSPTQLKAWEQYVNFSDGEKPGVRRISAKRLLRFTENQRGAVFHGFPTLRSAYGPWKVKLTLAIVEAMAHERAHLGTPTIRLPEGAADEDIDVAAEILASMNSQAKGFMILPHGVDFGWETVSKSDGTAIAETIERANRDIALNTGAGFMLLGLQGQSGSYALATSQQGQFEIGLETDAAFIASVINNGSDGWSAVERLTRLNYGEQVAVPQLVTRNMPTRDWSRVLPVIHNLSTSGVIRSDEKLEGFIRDVLRLPQRDQATERLSAATATQVLPMEETDDAE